MPCLVLPLALASLAVAAPSAADPIPAGYTLIPGSFPAGRQPDGNTIVIDAPAGLIVVDTGRHAQHREKILALARARGRPVAAIVNSHWHLDHDGGNRALRAAFPRADLYASRAVEGALTGFLARSRKEAEAFLASGRAGPEQAAEMRGFCDDGRPRGADADDCGHALAAAAGGGATAAGQPRPQRGDRGRRLAV